MMNRDKFTDANDMRNKFAFGKRDKSASQPIRNVFASENGVLLYLFFFLFEKRKRKAFNARK